MYQIFADDTLIYDSTLEDYKLGKASVTLEVNKSGSFTFSVYPDHFYYNLFTRLKTIVTVYKSGKIIFRGRILSDVTDYWNNKVITCEGELGFLQDSIIRPYKYIGTVEDLLKIWIDDHNEQVDECKQFKLGKITVNPPKGYIEYEGEDYRSTLSYLSDDIVGKMLNGYLYITHGEDGTDPIPTLNYLADFEKISTQTIEFGSNLKDYSKTVKANDIATAIIPLGAEIDDDNSETKDQRLTISAINDGLDYIYDANGVALYGWIFKVVTWDEITSDYELLHKAEDYFKEALGQKNTIELNAIDLHLLNPNIESISIGEYVKAKSEPHDMDITLLCSGQTIDLLKPENDSFTLGKTYTTISGLNNTLNKNIKSNYITNKRFIREFKKTTSLIYQTEEKIMLEVASTYATQTELESVEERTLSQIKVEKDNILLEVSSTYSKKSDLEELEERTESKIELQKDSILLSVSGTYATKTSLKSLQTSVSAELELKIGRDENNQIISMINASANRITLNSNRLVVNSDNFKLTSDGTLTTKNAILSGTFYLEDSVTLSGGTYTSIARIDDAGIWVKTLRTNSSAGDSTKGAGLAGGTLVIDTDELANDRYIALINVAIGGGYSHRVYLDTSDNTIFVQPL